MSRRRSISTTISLDKLVNQLAREAGDFAALLYTWMIPHAEDSASITGDPEELLYTVVPGLRHKTVDDIAGALTAMDRLGLVAWDRDAGVVYFDSGSFYRHQSYIPTPKRSDNGAHFHKHRESPQNAEERRESPQNASSLSPSPSPSLSLSPSLEKPPGAEAPANIPDLFEEFWNAWPNRKGSKQLAHKRFRMLTTSQQRKTIAGCSHLAEALELGLVEPTYQPRAENFVGGTKRYFEEWADGIPNHLRAGNRRPTALGALREVARQLESEVTV